MDDRALKPCPFCGPGNSIPGVWFDDTVNAHRVNCGRCGSGTGFNPRNTEADAIAAWNTRAADRLSEREGWREIESAEKNTRVWAWGPSWAWSNGCEAFVHAEYNGHTGIVCRDGRAGPPYRIGEENAPTHYMPLPSPPGKLER